MATAAVEVTHHEDSYEPSSNDVLRDLRLLKEVSSRIGTLKNLEGFFEQKNQLSQQLKEKEDLNQSLWNTYISNYQSKKDEVMGLKEKLERSKKDVEKLNGNIKESKKNEQKLNEACQAAERMVKSEKDNVEKVQKLSRELQDEIKRKDKRIRDLEDELAKANRDAKLAETSIGKHINDIQGLRSQLQGQETKLQELSRFSIPRHQDLDYTINKLWSIWDLVIERTAFYFNGELPDSVLEDKFLWEQPFVRNIDSLLNPSNIPLYPSNTPSAKFMRTTWVLHRLANLIDQYLLQPCYALDETDTLRFVLFDLASTESAKESHIRAALLSINEENQRLTKHQRMKKIERDLKNPVEEFLLPTKTWASFQEDLAQLLKAICEVWADVQRLEPKIEALFEPEIDADFEWRPLRLSNPNKPNRAKNDKDSIVPAEEFGAAIFPAMFTIAGEAKLVVPGVCIRKIQMDHALKEKEETFSKRPLQRGGTVNRKNQPRRPSLPPGNISSRSERSRENSFLASSAASGGAVANS